MSGKTLPEYWQNFKRQVDERRARGKPDMPTGFRWIDDITDGIGRGQLWIIAGTPGGGKTTLALNIAKNIADGNKSVLFISLEMTGEQLVARLFCDYADIAFPELRVGNYPVEFAEKEKSFLTFISSIDFELVERGYTFQEIEKIITSYYPGGKHPDLIVIDFVQLIDCGKEDQRTAYEGYIRKLAELSKVKNIGILVVSQFRRPPNTADINRAFELTDLKGTAAFEQLTHVAILIDRFFKKDHIGQIDKTRPYFNVRIAKNRYGEMGEREMAFEGEKFRFTEKEWKDFATD